MPRRKGRRRFAIAERKPNDAQKKGKVSEEEVISKESAIAEKKPNDAQKKKEESASLNVKEKGKVSEEAISEEHAIAEKKPNDALKKEKRRKGGREKRKDPTTLSPHELKEKEFLLKYSFIRVNKDMDDFQPLRMDHRVLSAFQQHLAPSIVEYHHLYEMDGEELTARPAHAALCMRSDVWRITLHI